MILFDDSYLLLGKSFKIDDKIIINNPRLYEIFDFGEEKYYSILSPFIAKPSDYKVQLFDMGVDFEKVNEFEFFCMLIKNIKQEDSSILFGNLDFSKMELYIRTDTKEKMIGYDDIFINELAYKLMSDFIRKINDIPIKQPEKYLNDHVKQYRLEVERNAYKANQRKKKEPYRSMLIPIVSGLVNHPGNTYDYNSIMDLTISQLHDSLDRTQKINNYNNVMMGLYSGNIAKKDINMQEVNWLS